MSADFLAPDVIKKVFVELKDLTQNPPEGIKVVINEEDVTDVQALIDGPGNGSSQITFKLRIQNYFIFYESSLLIVLIEDTPFAGGVFKMKLKLGSEYPQAPPKGYFLTKIFHPNVSDKGEICVNTLKKDWKADMGIRHLLLVSRSFCKIFLAVR
jgi:ubiquitin-conjugating enzyme E2 S